MRIVVAADKGSLGDQAAQHVASVISETIAEQGVCRVIFATGASQFEFLAALVKLPVDWSSVIGYHLDEYELSADHPASFRKYLNDRLFSVVRPAFKAVHLIDPALPLAYAHCLLEGDIDLACIGIGENGHIAFNDPHEADFGDVDLVKRVTLDDACRQQQVSEGWFPDLDSVPCHAVTVTIPGIMRARVISCVVPEARKADAVFSTRTAPLSTAYPSTILRNHLHCTLFLDQHSASHEVPVSMPGCVDLQVNGYHGIDFTSITLTQEEVFKACRAVLQTGTAAMVATMVTAPMEVYEHCIPLLANAVQSEEFAGRVLGIHLEGPFISTVPGAVGCHRSEYAILPDLDKFKRMMELARGTLRILTIAAELPKADVLTRYAVSHGVVVSLGHQTALEPDIRRLTDCGATLLTHLGNGVPTNVHRHLNPIWAGLSEERLTACIITDGHHLPPTVIGTMIRAKGARKVILVSDIAAVAGLEPGVHPCMGKHVRVCPDGSVREVDNDRLAGSGSNMLMCVNHLASLGVMSVRQLEMVAFENPLRAIHVDPGVVRAAVKPMLRFNMDGQFELM